MEKTELEVRSLPIRSRAAFSLTIAEACMVAIEEDREASVLAESALALAWGWVAGEPVKGHSIASFLEGHDERNLGLYELNWDPGKIRSGLVAIVAAIAYVANFAYDVEGSRVRADSIWEATDELIPDLLEHGLKAGRFEEKHARALLDFLLRERGSDVPSALGKPIARVAALEAAGVARYV